MKKKVVLFFVLMLICFAGNHSIQSIEQEERKSFIENTKFNGKKYAPVDLSKMPKSMQQKIN